MDKCKHMISKPSDDILLTMAREETGIDFHNMKDLEMHIQYGGIDFMRDILTKTGFHRVGHICNADLVYKPEHKIDADVIDRHDEDDS